MRATYSPDSEKFWVQYFLAQSKQTGAGFIGTPYQRGAGLGSLFRGIFRSLMPIVKSAGKAIGKQALSAGAEIASDVVAGKPIKAAVKRRSKASVSALLSKAAAEIEGPKRKRKPVKKRRKLADTLGQYYG